MLYRTEANPLTVKNPEKKIFEKSHQKLRLEISGGPLKVKTSISAHLVVENPEKHTFGQNCPKYDATVNILMGPDRLTDYNPHSTNSRVCNWNNHAIS